MFQLFKSNIFKSNIFKISSLFILLLVTIIIFFAFKKPKNEIHMNINYETNSKYSIKNCTRDEGFLQNMTGNFYNLTYCMKFPIFENRKWNQRLFDEINSKIYHYKKSNLNNVLKNDKFELYSNYQTFSSADDNSVSIQMQFLEKNLTKKTEFEFLKTYIFKDDKLIDSKTFFKNNKIKDIVELIKKQFIKTYTNNKKIPKINLEKAFPYNLNTLRNFVETPNSIIFFYERGEILPKNYKIISIELEKSQIYDCIKDEFKPKQKIEKKSDVKPKIALTFDDGPNHHCTNEILNILNENDAKATFFVLGKNCSDNFELLKRMVEENHEIGNHTYSHINLNSTNERKINKEIENTNALIAQATGGYKPSFIRPPYGSCNKKIKNLINYPLILWSIDTLDWKTKNASKTIEKVLNLADDGSIILMHDIYNETVEAARVLVPKLIEKGFELVTISNLFDSKGLTLEPHNMYYNAKNLYKN